MILEPGNLLSMARLNFRVKCNNQFWGIRSPGTLSALQKQAFFMECACSYELYKIKWQAILLRMYPFPPRIYERFIFYPEVASLPLYNKKEKLAASAAFVFGECTGKGSNEWKSNTGKIRNILFSAIKNANIFHAIRERIRMILTVFFAIAHCMRWATNAGAISGTQIRGSKTAPIASFLIRERITAM